MTLNPLPRLRALVARARAAWPALRAWGAARLRERSTYVGIATAVSAFGFQAIGDRLAGLADVLAMVGAGLAAASTSRKPASTDGDA